MDSSLHCLCGFLLRLTGLRGAHCSASGIQKATCITGHVHSAPLFALYVEVQSWGKRRIIWFAIEACNKCVQACLLSSNTALLYYA